jgi:glycine/D-amino acid oxidase-like deaminating enzyme
MTNYDALVVGAGVLGLSTAYHIKLADPSLKVLVVDKNLAAGLGSTVNSAAAFRCFFSSSANFALADSSVEFYKHLHEVQGVDLNMHWCGYLWCFTQDAYEMILPILEELQTKGLEYEEYVPEELIRILRMRVSFARDPEAKRLGIGDVFRAVFVPKAGLIGVMSLVRFYESEFLRMGGEIQYHTEVTKLIIEPRLPVGLPGEPYFWQHAVVVGTETSSGKIKAKKTVVAAGAWLSQLLDPIGVECYVKARKRQVFSVKADTPASKSSYTHPSFPTPSPSPLPFCPNPQFTFDPT